MAAQSQDCTPRRTGRMGKPVREDWVDVSSIASTRRRSRSSSSRIRSASPTVMQAHPGVPGGSAGSSWRRRMSPTRTSGPRHLMTFGPYPRDPLALSLDHHRQPQRSLLQPSRSPRTSLRPGDRCSSMRAKPAISNAESGYYGHGRRAPWLRTVPVAAVAADLPDEGARQPSLRRPERQLLPPPSIGHEPIDPSRHSGLTSFDVHGENAGLLALPRPCRRCSATVGIISSSPASMVVAIGPGDREIGRADEKLASMPVTSRMSSSAVERRARLDHGEGTCARWSHSASPAQVIAAGAAGQVGPQERSPSGGYFIEAAKRTASSTELIIGAMTASAPKSSARLAMSLRPTGMRTECRIQPAVYRRDACTLSSVMSAMLHVERHGLVVAGPHHDFDSQKSGQGRPTRRLDTMHRRHRGAWQEHDTSHRFLRLVHAFNQINEPHAKCENRAKRTRQARPTRVAGAVRPGP